MPVYTLYPPVCLRDKQFGMDDLLDRQNNAVLYSQSDGSSVDIFRTVGITFRQEMSNPEFSTALLAYSTYFQTNVSHKLGETLRV